MLQTHLLIITSMFFFSLSLYAARPKFFKTSKVEGKEQIVFRIADLPELKEEIKGKEYRDLEGISEALFEIEKFYIEYVEPSYGETIVKVYELLNFYHLAMKLQIPGFWEIFFTFAPPRGLMHLTNWQVVLRKFSTGVWSSFRIGLCFNGVFFGLHIPFDPREHRTVEVLSLDKKEPLSLTRVPGASLVGMGIASAFSKVDVVAINPQALHFREKLKAATPAIDSAHGYVFDPAWMKNVTYPMGYFSLMVLAALTKAPMVQKLFPTRDSAKKFRQENVEFLSHSNVGVCIIAHSLLYFLLACDRVAEMAEGNRSYQLAQEAWEEEFDLVSEHELSDSE